MKEHIGRAWNFLRRRKQAYHAAFPLDKLRDNLVLRDLARFCRANTTCWHPDARVHAHYEGRREVWLRIMHHLKLPADVQFELYGGRDEAPTGVENE